MNITILEAVKFVQNFSLQGFIWIAILIAALIIEVIIKKSIALWFCPAAIICFILTTFETKFVYQVLTFIFLSLFLLIINHWNYLKSKSIDLRKKVDQTIKSSVDKA